MSEISQRLGIAIADRYRIERELGQGGMATVYLADDIKHDRKVAMKVLRPELSALLGGERFLNEIRVTAHLQHPHILPLFDSGAADGLLYYVMPYVEGESLRTRLTREKQLPIADAIAITKAVANALDYAHRHNIIHRDIKPENILIHDGQPVVADFGIALAVRVAGGHRLTETGLSLGTPFYMSPEQATGDRELDGRSDIYSLGCVAYEMLAGDPPHTGSTAQAVIAKIVTETPQLLSHARPTVPTYLETAIHTALERLPADRFATAAQFVEALDGKGLRGSGGQAATRAVAARVPDRRAGFLLGLLLVTSALAVWGWLRVGRQPATGANASPTRFAIELGPGQEFFGSAVLLLASQGRTLLLTGVENGRPRLLARPLDRMEMTAIQGPNTPERPFLSPDGSWVAFTERGKLWKMPIEGGTPVALAQSRWGGGSWSPTGVIVYTPTYQSGLWRVTDRGGDARALSEPDTARGELAHWWPQILPDGKHVLFSAYRTPIDRATIELLSLETGKRRVLVEGGIFGRYVSSGHLLYALYETVFAVPFDARRLEITGAAVPVIEDVAGNTSDGHAAYAVSDEGTLAYARASTVEPDLLLVLTDRRGAERQLLPVAERYGRPRLSPSGNRVALDITNTNGTSDVWVYELVKGVGTRLTTNPADDFGATWSANGRELIYMSERPLFELYRRAADASRPEEPFLTGAHDRINGALSADGRLLTFTASAPTGPELWHVPPDRPGEAQRYLRDGFNLGHPALSPNRQWMAYDSDESGRREVYLQSFPDPTRGRRRVSGNGGTEPLWSRGGRELVFRTGDSVMAAAVDPETGEAGTPVALFHGPYSRGYHWTEPTSYDVTQDGARFVLVRRPANMPPRRVIVVLNWFEELRRRMASAR